MNVIYKLTNLDKEKSPKYYIGSKIECTLSDMDGIPTIIDKNEYPYYGSSSSFIMKEDLLNHRFKAEILEKVEKRSDVYLIEQKYLEKYDVKNNKDYYNLTNNTMKGINYCKDCPVNKFGENVDQLAASKRGISNRNSNAKRMGFKNFHECVLFIYKTYTETSNFSEVARILKAERHSPANIIRGINLEKCKKEIDNFSEKISKEVFDLYRYKASYHKIAEILNLELPTVTMYLDDFIQKNNKSLSARKLNINKKELTSKIVKDFLKGYTLVQACQRNGINHTTGKRYFNEYIRERLNINDI